MGGVGGAPVLVFYEGCFAPLARRVTINYGIGPIPG